MFQNDLKEALEKDTATQLVMNSWEKDAFRSRQRAELGVDILVGRPVIREHHLILKIPHYFDETTSSKPDLSQSVTPLTPSLAKSCRVCAQPCTACTPFVLQGYDNTLCSLTMKRPDRPLVPQVRRRRPHVDAFADLTPIDESTLIDKSQLHIIYIGPVPARTVTLPR
jgi:hypothetical protein